jgi:hypothetical protein
MMPILWLKVSAENAGKWCNGRYLVKEAKNALSATPFGDAVVINMMEYANPMFLTIKR